MTELFGQAASAGEPRLLRAGWRAGQRGGAGHGGGAAGGRSHRRATRGSSAKRHVDSPKYQRLTAEGKLGEAGQRLDSLKLKLEQLQRGLR